MPWAPVTRNSQSTMLLYGWWPLWTRPSIGYSQTERSRHTHTPCGIHLTNEKQSLIPCTPRVFPESASWMLARNAGDPTPSPATGLMVTGMVGRSPLSFTGRRPGTSPR